MIFFGITLFFSVGMKYDEHGIGWLKILLYLECFCRFYSGWKGMSSEIWFEGLENIRMSRGNDKVIRLKCFDCFMDWIYSYSTLEGLKYWMCFIILLYSIQPSLSRFPGRCTDIINNVLIPYRCVEKQWKPFIVWFEKTYPTDSKVPQRKVDSLLQTWEETHPSSTRE